jgi:hypothetical protein
MKYLLTLPLMLSLAGPARGAVFTNLFSADAFVRSNAPTSNYGGAGALSVSGAQATNALGTMNGAFDSFIRCNTAAAVSNFNSLYGAGNWVINGATLQVFETGAPNNNIFNRGVGAFEIRWIANDTWTEGTGMPNGPTTNGISYSLEPTLLNSGTDLHLGTYTNAGADGTLSLALALPGGFVNDIAAGGEVGLFMTALDPGTGFTFNSRSFMTNSMRPVLLVSALPQPGIAAIQLSGTDVVLSATNGALGAIYSELASTNIALPLNQWATLGSSFLSSNRDFSITLTNAVDTATPAEHYFILQAR